MMKNILRKENWREMIKGIVCLAESGDMPKTTKKMSATAVKSIRLAIYEICNLW